MLVLVFGAFTNAAGMIEPVVKMQDQLWAGLGKPPRLFVTTLCYVFAIVVLPLVAVGLAAAFSRSWGKLADGWIGTSTDARYRWTVRLR